MQASTTLRDLADSAIVLNEQVTQLRASALLLQSEGVEGRADAIIDACDAIHRDASVLIAAVLSEARKKVVDGGAASLQIADPLVVALSQLRQRRVAIESELALAQQAAAPVAPSEAEAPVGAEGTLSVYAAKAGGAHTASAEAQRSFFADRLHLFRQGATGLPGAAGGIPPGHTAFSWRWPPRPDARLRAVQEAVTAGVREVLADAPAEADMAARAWMSLATFEAIVALPEVRAVLAQIARRELTLSDGSPAGVVVLGVGAGMFQAYLSILLGVPSRGYDDDPVALHVAQCAAEAGDVLPDAPDGVSFHEGNVASLPVADGALCRAAVVFIESSSWEPAVRRLVYGMLVANLPHGALVIDCAPLLPSASRPLVIPLVEAHTGRGVIAGSSPRSAGQPDSREPALEKQLLLTSPRNLLTASGGGSGSPHPLVLMDRHSPTSPATLPTALELDFRSPAKGSSSLSTEEEGDLSLVTCESTSSVNAALSGAAAEPSRPFFSADAAAMTPYPSALQQSGTLAISVPSAAVIRRKAEVRLLAPKGVLCTAEAKLGAGPPSSDSPSFYLSQQSVRVEGRD